MLQVLAYENTDIALIQETWFSAENNVTTAKIKKAGYNIIHVHREKREAGVAVLYRNNLNALTAKCGISGSNYVSFQHQCSIFNFNPKIHLISIYRHQEISINIFVVELEKLLNAHSKYSHSILLAGDFNVHYEITNSPDKRKLDNVLSAFGLAQHVTDQTHKLKHTLDLIFTNPYEIDVTVTPVLDYCLSDHFPVIFKLNNLATVNDNNGCKRIVYRNIREIIIDNFKADISTQLNASFHENLNFQSQYNLFSDIASNVLDKFPHKSLKLFVQILPFLGLTQSIGRRGLLDTSWRESGKSPKTNME